jgi:hypothetical protein
MSRELAQGRKILRRNDYDSYLGLKRRGKRVRTMPAPDPQAAIADAMQQNRCGVR